MGFTIVDNDVAAFPVQAEVFETDLRIVLAGVAGAAVIAGCAVSAQVSPDMTVAVAGGTIQNAPGDDATVTGGNLTIDAADSTLWRIDLISANSIAVKTYTAGTAAVATAVKPPAVPSGNIALAFVTVPPGATAITGDLIIDKRVFAAADTADIGSDSADIAGVNFTVQGSTPATPGSGHAVIYVKADGAYIVLHSGTVIGPFAVAGGAPVTVATDTIWAAAGDLAVGTGSHTAAKLASGALGTVLTGVAVGTAPTWAAPPLAISQATLGGDVTLTTQNTYYDGPSLSLPAGTYLLWAQVDINPGTFASYLFLSARIDSGGTVIAEAGNVALTSGTEVEVFVVGTVVLATTTTVKIRASWGPSGGGTPTVKMEREISGNSATSHTATHLVALRIA